MEPPGGTVAACPLRTVRETLPSPGAVCRAPTCRCRADRRSGSAVALPPRRRDRLRPATLPARFHGRIPPRGSADDPPDQTSREGTVRLPPALPTRTGTVLDRPRRPRQTGTDPRAPLRAAWR